MAPADLVDQHVLGSAIQMRRAQMRQLAAEGFFDIDQRGAGRDAERLAERASRLGPEARGQRLARTPRAEARAVEPGNGVSTPSSTAVSAVSPLGAIISRGAIRAISSRTPVAPAIRVARNSPVETSTAASANPPSPAPSAPSASRKLFSSAASTVSSPTVPGVITRTICRGIRPRCGVN